MSDNKPYNKMSESEKKKEDWMNSKWRPMMGWMYMVTCITDFVIFPVLWSLAQTLLKQPITQWQPLTLQGAGLFHIAMGAVLGIAAYGRTQEKLGGANNGGLQVSNSTSGPTAFGASATTGFGAPASTFGGSNITNVQGSTFNSGSFGSVPSTAPAPVATGWGGKKVVPFADQPEI